MKKILALVLALMMAVCMFSACSKDGEKDTPKEEEKVVTGAEAVLEEYLENIVKCKSYALNFTEYNTEGYFASVEAINGSALAKQQLMDFIGAPEAYEGKVSEYFDDFLEKAYGNSSFEIESVETEETKATAKIITKTPSFNNIATAVNNVDMLSLVQKHYPDGLENAPEEEVDEATYNLMKIVFDDVLNDDSIYESNSATIELEKIDGEWLVVNIF